MSRKQDIIDAATELFSQKGYHATSTHQVAKLAEVSEGIIFYYFKTKEDILLEIFYGSFDSFLQTLQQILEEARTGLEALHSFVELHFSAIDLKAKDILLLVRDFPANLVNHNSPHRKEIMERVNTLNRCLESLIQRGQEDGSVGPCDPEQFALVLRSLLVGATRVALLEHHPDNRFKEALWEFCLRALKPNPSQA